MVNELYDAARSLDASGISPKDWHKEYVPVRKPSKQKPAFFVYVDQHGDITNVEQVDDPKMTAELRTWESKGDLRQSFPYFNVPPLLWIRFDPKKNDDDKSLDKSIKASQLTDEQLRNFMERAEKADTTKQWDDNAYRKLQSCLEKGNKLKAILGQSPDECRAIVELTTRLESVSAEALRDKLYK